MSNDLLPHLVLLLNFFCLDDTLFFKLISLIIFLKIKTLSNNLSKIEEKLNLNGNSVHFWTLFHLMLEAITICHIIATLYYFCGKLQQIYGTQNNQNWINLRNLQDSTPFTCYIQSFYWSIATIMLIGTQGETDVETVFAVLSLLVTVGYFAKILSQVSMVMDQMEQQKKAYKQEKEVMNSFFNLHKDFPPQLQKEYFMPNQIIFQRNIQEESKLYLLVEGQIELYQDTGEQQSSLQVINAGNIFGLHQFFTNYEPYYSSRSCQNSFSTALVVKRSEESQEDLEKFQMIVDQLKFQGSTKFFDYQCYICSSKLHYEADCGICNYRPNKQNIIDRNNYSIPQKRNQNNQEQIKFIRKRNFKNASQINFLKSLKDARKLILLEPKLRIYIKDIQMTLNKQKIDFDTSTDEDLSQDSIISDSEDDDSEFSNECENIQHPFYNKKQQNSLNDVYEETEQMEQSENNLQGSLGNQIKKKSYLDNNKLSMVQSYQNTHNVRNQFKLKKQRNRVSTYITNENDIKQIYNKQVKKQNNFQMRKNMSIELQYENQRQKNKNSILEFDKKPYDQ
ncbi:Cyclic nucleotide-binding protein [Pseudocohnilembus persalinus]|uniref:Cyclic nucleotide-binding protein n=1 Tax=Pseudocohnilembus persalinus TaxID=266149 RepID=A0A0V0QBC0_PSEPJ|nr:Cyclic nucleotide-binding protein [Pseudocohnilembus persalinus]|eukprot:KRW99509.1 Cyclic nucleotide-binding protein [Pseudocohnilembus persalinus]